MEITIYLKLLKMNFSVMVRSPVAQCNMVSFLVYSIPRGKGKNRPLKDACAKMNSQQNKIIIGGQKYAYIHPEKRFNNYISYAQRKE